MSAWPLFVLVVLILLNALYVAAEFAIVGARASRVEEFAAQGSRMAQALLPIVRNGRRLDDFIAACQIGITVSSLVLGAFGQATLGIALGAWLHASAGMDEVSAFGTSALIVLVVLSSIQVVFGELIPKTVALQFPVRTSMALYLPMRWSLALFTPFIRLLNGSGNALLRLFGAGHAGSHQHVHSAEEIDMLLRESADEGAIAPGESARLRAGLRLARRNAWQLMVPRRDIVGIDLAEDTDLQLARIRQSPYTRLIVYRGGFDAVLGFLHVKDLASHLARGGSLDGLPSLLRPLLKMPGGLSAERVLQQLRQHRARLALVVSEFGDVEGLLTLQDLMSEVIGETADEFKSVADDEPVPLDERRWRAHGDMDAERFLRWARDHGVAARLHPGDAVTLAGMIMTTIDAVPSEGQTLQIDDLQFGIERMRGMAVDTVIVTLRGTAEEPRDD